MTNEIGGGTCIVGKTEHPFDSAFCKALMHNVRFLDPPPFSFVLFSFVEREQEVAERAEREGKPDHGPEMIDVSA